MIFVRIVSLMFTSCGAFGARCSLTTTHPSVRRASPLIDERDAPVDGFGRLFDLRQRAVAQGLHMQVKVQTLRGKVGFTKLQEFTHASWIGQKLLATERPATHAKLSWILYPRHAHGDNDENAGQERWRRRLQGLGQVPSISI